MPAATTIINTLGRCGDVHRAWDAFEQVPSPNTFVSSAMITACEKARGEAEWDCAVKLLDEMWEWGVEPDVFNYSAAISACEKEAQWERALELLMN
jgi:pentatricopeptide repeat protein